MHLKGLVIMGGLENQYSRQSIITESQDWKERQMLLSPALFPALASGVSVCSDTAQLYLENVAFWGWDYDLECDHFLRVNP